MVDVLLVSVNMYMLVENPGGARFDCCSLLRIGDHRVLARPYIVQHYVDGM